MSKISNAVIFHINYIIPRIIRGEYRGFINPALWLSFIENVDINESISRCVNTRMEY